ncbi:phosphate transporter [Bacillus sp. BP-3]|uniref:phosphate transporter n=1 Tax=Bacillus sp. BP-3 TaxID=3022773 RepID=UPI002330F82D|nr:phosphate transporter [Bacillus sp. BP-3]MDC2863702.1 phosphate transporter [Bacillus sp. BP-3]
MNKYIKKEKHSLIISNNNTYNSEEGVYEVINDAIREVITLLNSKYCLYIYYLDTFKSKDEVKSYVKLKGFLNRNVVVFEPLDLSFLNDEYISERFIIGGHEIEHMLNSIKTNVFNSMDELETYLQDRCEIFCKIFDSSYIEVQAQDASIITEINNVI